MLNKTFKYELVENHSDPKFATIKKTGIESEFTLQKIADDISYLEKKRTELQGLITVEEAKKQNIVHFNPKVLKLTEKERMAVYMYQESFATVKVGLEKLQEIEDGLKEYQHEIEEIKKQTGVSVEVPAPAQPAVAEPEEKTNA